MEILIGAVIFFSVFAGIILVVKKALNIPSEAQRDETKYEESMAFKALDPTYEIDPEASCNAFVSRKDD